MVIVLIIALMFVICGIGVAVSNSAITLKTALRIEYTLVAIQFGLAVYLLVHLIHKP